MANALLQDRVRQLFNFCLLFIIFMNEGSVIDSVYSSYMDILHVPEEGVDMIGNTIPIPCFPASVVSQLFELALKKMKEMLPVISVPHPVVVVGDLHGNFHDLVRILVSSNNSFQTAYLFLGDYVDRGDYSLDVLMLLLVLTLKYPLHFYLLRGNHEFTSVNGSYGFRDEIMDRYENDELWIKANELFYYLPIGVLIGTEILCIHGGIGPNVSSLKSISNLKFPIYSYSDSAILAEILWSDPTSQFIDFSTSLRGTGALFGRGAVHEFLKSSNLKMIIRGHQCVQEGISYCLGKQVLTIFSSSDYGGIENKAGYALVNVDPVKIVTTILQSRKYVKREKALMIQIGKPTIRPIMTFSDLASSKFRIAQSIPLKIPESRNANNIPCSPRQSGNASSRYVTCKPRVHKLSRNSNNSLRSFTPPPAKLPNLVTDDISLTDNPIVS